MRGRYRRGINHWNHLTRPIQPYGRRHPIHKCLNHIRIGVGVVSDTAVVDRRPVFGEFSKKPALIGCYGEPVSTVLTTGIDDFGPHPFAPCAGWRHVGYLWRENQLRSQRVSRDGEIQTFRTSATLMKSCHAKVYGGCTMTVIDSCGEGSINGSPGPGLPFVARHHTSWISSGWNLQTYDFHFRRLPTSLALVVSSSHHRRVVG